MFVKVELFDANRIRRGEVKLFFDWRLKTWSLKDDPANVWNNICLAKSGRFEIKEWGVAWLWDGQRNILILWNAPNTEMDLFAPSAEGKIYDPINLAFKDGKLAWSIDFTASLNAGTTPAAPAQPLSAFRMHLLNRLNQLLPAPYLSANYNVLAPGLTRSSPGTTGGQGVYTSCGSMPGFVTSEMGTFKGKKFKAHQEYMDRYSLNGTNIVRIKGVRYKCWKENDLVERPKPGDIYALLNNGATDKQNSGISHVGVIEKADGDMWTTMDLGQGTGFDGKRVERHYKAAEGELFGETLQGGGYRVLAGWVNVDDYLMLG